MQKSNLLAPFFAPVTEQRRGCDGEEEGIRPRTQLAAEAPALGIAGKAEPSHDVYGLYNTSDTPGPKSGSCTSEN